MTNCNQLRRLTSETGTVKKASRWNKPKRYIRQIREEVQLLMKFFFFILLCMTYCDARLCKARRHTTILSMWMYSLLEHFIGVQPTLWNDFLPVLHKFFTNLLPVNSVNDIRQRNKGERLKVALFQLKHYFRSSLMHERYGRDSGFITKNVIKFVSTGVINGRHGKVLNVSVV